MQHVLGQEQSPGIQLSTDLNSLIDNLTPSSASSNFLHFPQLPSIENECEENSLSSLPLPESSCEDSLPPIAPGRGDLLAPLTPSGGYSFQGYAPFPLLNYQPYLYRRSKCHCRLPNKNEPAVKLFDLLLQLDNRVQKCCKKCNKQPASSTSLDRGVTLSLGP